MSFFMANFWKLGFSKLKRLTLVFITRKIYLICLSFHLTLTSLINFEYAIAHILVYHPQCCGTLSTYHSIYVFQNVTRIRKINETDNYLHSFEYRKTKKG